MMKANDSNDNWLYTRDPLVPAVLGTDTTGDEMLCGCKFHLLHVTLQVCQQGKNASSKISGVKEVSRF